MVVFSYYALVPSSISSSWFDFPSCSVSSFHVSKEELHAFHRMDRLLYSRLVIELSRNIVESVHVMALWSWLEKNGKVVERLLETSNWIVDALANEAVAIHKCLLIPEFPCSSSKVSDVPLTRSLVKSNVNLLSLQFFHEKRESIVSSLSHIAKDFMSLGVFDDIINGLHCDSFTKKPNMISPNNIHLPSPSNITELDDQLIHNPLMHQMMPTSYTTQVMSPQIPSLSLVNNQPYIDPLLLQPASNPMNLALDRNRSNHGISEMLNSLSLEGFVNKEKSNISREALDDERTIFLTFSKGYLVLEHEIREFFTRKHGDIIEEICMQEVPPQEQPLYARLVVRHASVIEEVLEFKSKAKFNINGKHVWARKYVKKSIMK